MQFLYFQANNNRWNMASGQGKSKNYLILYLISMPFLCRIRKNILLTVCYDLCVLYINMGKTMTYSKGGNF